MSLEAETARKDRGVIVEGKELEIRGVAANSGGPLCACFLRQMARTRPTVADGWSWLVDGLPRSENSRHPSQEVTFLQLTF